MNEDGHEKAQKAQKGGAEDTGEMIGQETDLSVPLSVPRSRASEIEASDRQGAKPWALWDVTTPRHACQGGLRTLRERVEQVTGEQWSDGMW